MNSDRISMEPESCSTESSRQNPPPLSRLSIPRYSQFIKEIEFESSRISQNEENRNQPHPYTSAQLEIGDSSFCSTCCSCGSNISEFEEGRGRGSLASLPNYSQFMRNVEFASSRAGGPGGSGIGENVAGNRATLQPIVEEREESDSFCTTCDLNIIRETTRQGQSRNFNPCGNPSVASLGGYSEFEGNVRIASSAISTREKLTPQPNDALDQTIWDDDELSFSFSDCSTCCGSESEDELPNGDGERTFKAPEQASFAGRSLRSGVSRGLSGSVAEFAGCHGMDLDGSFVSTYSGFQRGLHGREEEQEHPLSSSINPPPRPTPINTRPRRSNNQKTQKRKRAKKCQKMGSTFHCRICSKPFKHPDSSKRHEKTHMNWAELEKAGLFHKKCAPCDKIFLGSTRYREHMDMHAGRKPLKCPHPNCQKSYTHQGTLAKHKHTHLSESEKKKLQQGWKHSCYFCDRKFLTPTNLNRHLTVHIREKPFHCDHTHKGSKCDSRFTRNGSLKNHRRTHLENKGRSFLCNICDKAFAQKSNLISHVKTVHEKKKDFKCTEKACGKEFGRQGDLKTHFETVHLRLKPHKCPNTKCNKAFGERVNLNRHVKAVHK